MARFSPGVGKPPPRPASVSARSTDCIFYLSQGLSGQLAAGCAAAQPQYHIPPQGGWVGCWKMVPRRYTRPVPERRCKDRRCCLRARKDRKVQSSAPVDADPAPPPPAPEGALPPRIGQALAQLGKPPPRPASVSARSTDCIFYLSQGLSGQLAAGCAAAQPQYHIPPIPYYLRRGSHGVGTGDGRRDRRGIAQSAMT